MCIASYYDNSSGLNIEMWSGSEKVTGSPRLVCWIDDYTTDAYHIVEVESTKTYARRVFVKGIIPDVTQNAAAFTGPLSQSPTKWEDSANVTPQRTVATLGRARIEKRLRGFQEIGIEVQHEDSWNPGVLKTASSFSRHLVIEIQVR